MSERTPIPGGWICPDCGFAQHVAPDVDCPFCSAYWADYDDQPRREYYRLQDALYADYLPCVRKWGFIGLTDELATRWGLKPEHFDKETNE